MKLIFIISVGALFLLLTSSVEAATLGGIEPSIEKLNALETRQESLKGCSMSSLDKCYGTVPPDGSVPNDLLEEIGHISDAQTCQRFCNELYNGTCQWFMFDKTTEDCKLFSSPLNDLWNDCREVGYAREPDHELCDEMFPSDSSNGCYNFREDYCRYEFSLLENLEEIDSLSECQLACQYINNCSYFVYDSPSKICKLNTQLSQKTCDIIHGTPQPDLNTCISGGRIDWASNSGQPVTATERPAPTSTTTITTTTPTTTTTTTTTTLTTTTSTPNTTTTTPTATNTGASFMIVNDGICPSGYSSTFTETECRELTGQTISNNEIGEFYYAGCSRFHPPAYTCFVGQQKPNPRTYYVTTTCGQTPNFDAVAHRVICKKLD